MSSVIEIDSSMAVCAGQSGVQAFAAGDMGSVSTDLGIGIGDIFKRKGGAVVRIRCSYAACS